ncbi:MULE domain-containing protein [Trichonephila clavipes]|nr:MULE domain-containing protein [Trichonephila clavipes]
MSKYVRQRGCKTLQNGEIVMNYQCCRSGTYKPKGKGLKNLKSQGSAKIGISCPAVIKVRQSTENVVVHYFPKHQNHETQLEHLRLSESDRSAIAGKFKKDELRSIADELKLVVPDNAKVLDLRELIQESEIYKNDKETYQAIVDCVLEEINDKRNENENRLEIEKKIKLSHVKTCCAKNCFCGKPHHRLIHFLKPESVALNQTVQRSVLNPLADVFGGPGGSNCVVPPQGENERKQVVRSNQLFKE